MPEYKIEYYYKTKNDIGISSSIIKIKNKDVSDFMKYSRADFENICKRGRDFIEFRLLSLLNIKNISTVIDKIFGEK